MFLTYFFNVYINIYIIAVHRCTIFYYSLLIDQFNTYSFLLHKITMISVKFNLIFKIAFVGLIIFDVTNGMYLDIMLI